MLTELIKKMLTAAMKAKTRILGKKVGVKVKGSPW